jgi:SRSO17 transposase
MRSVNYYQLLAQDQTLLAIRQVDADNLFAMPATDNCFGNPIKSGHAPLSVKELALGLPAKAWRQLAWREGTNTLLALRFARLRVRPAHRNYWRSDVRADVWLLIGMAARGKEPTKYWLSNLPSDTTIEKLVATAKMR